jgi:Ca2+-binding EF-hand superfamily protein
LAKKVFDCLDSEKEGVLSLPECIKAFKMLAPDKEIDETLFPHNSITFQEFLRIISIIIDNYNVCF